MADKPTLEDARQAILTALIGATERGMAADARNLAGAYEVISAIGTTDDFGNPNRRA